MVTRRKIILMLGAGVIAPRTTFAQQQGKVWRIGFLGVADADGYKDRVERLRAGLRELGYIEGRNIVIEFRWADGNSDRLTNFAADLARQKVDVIVTHATVGSRAAMLATSSIPIVMSVGDAVQSGIVSNLARPGGNVTGFTFFQQELIGKRIDLAKDISPRGTRFAVLVNPDSTNTPAFIKYVQNRGKSLKVEVLPVEARELSDFESAFLTMAKKHINAVVFFENAIFIANRKAFANAAIKYRIPSVGNPEFAEAGGLVGYGPDIGDLWHRKASYIDKILKGAKPSDLPVEQPAKFETIINLKTANALGVKVPQSILTLATKVIK